MKVIFESHATTVDNEAGLASGWNDVALSEIGELQAKNLGQRYADVEINAIFCPDLQRGYRTAQLAFPDVDPTFLFMDWRLRECDYGKMTRAPKDQVDQEKLHRIDKSFPGGESYQQTMERMGSFIADLKKQDFKTVLIIGSRATHYGLDHFIGGKSIEEAVGTKFKLQPGWEYKL